MGDTRIDRGRAAWWAIGATLTAALVYVVYTFVGTFVLGFFLYYATRPVYRRVDRHLRSSSVAAVVSLLVLALPVVVLLSYTTAVGIQELTRVLNAPQIDLTTVEALVQPYVDVSRAVQDPQSLLGQPSVRAAINTTLRSAGQYAGFLGTAFVHLFAVITIAFYLLRDDTRLAEWFHSRFADSDGVVRAYTAAIDADFSNIFFGNILFAFITGVIASITFNVLQIVFPSSLSIPYPTLMGLLTGAASLIPVVGIKLVWIPLLGWLAVAAARSGGGYGFVAVFGVVAAVVIDFIPDLVVRPYVSGRDLHLGLVMLAYVFGPLIWGWYGIFLGPMVLVFVVHFARLVLPELVAGEGIAPVPAGADDTPASEADPESAADPDDTAA
ncbi:MULTISPECIES: AI-2E family transporter [Halobacterium]|uniref:AI-2E family transporter n=1 Tax=Halobacterium TaxID=2239 RepID=UPI0019659DC7|nr:MULTISPECIES: AI-2E family transporter [Halobacterium]MDL0122363.1 AI-2E family transporter [Halobacterium salinarum]QRY23889.1 AI-2E family transporter [Halobacterium sp. BOL4-2]